MYANQSNFITKTSPGGAVWSGIIHSCIARYCFFSSRRDPYKLNCYAKETM